MQFQNARLVGPPLGIPSPVGFHDPKMLHDPKYNPELSHKSIIEKLSAALGNLDPGPLALRDIMMEIGVTSRREPGPKGAWFFAFGTNPTEYRGTSKAAEALYPMIERRLLENPPPKNRYLNSLQELAAVPQGPSLPVFHGTPELRLQLMQQYQQQQQQYQQQLLLQQQQQLLEQQQQQQEQEQQQQEQEQLQQQQPQPQLQEPQQEQHEEEQQLQEPDEELQQQQQQQENNEQQQQQQQQQQKNMEEQQQEKHMEQQQQQQQQQRRRHQPQREQPQLQLQQLLVPPQPLPDVAGMRMHYSDEQWQQYCKSTKALLQRDLEELASMQNLVMHTTQHAKRKREEANLAVLQRRLGLLQKRIKAHRDTLAVEEEEEDANAAETLVHNFQGCRRSR
ncbi:hypothetical protein DUNSADRAFT_1166 [Dunaliella salina]|uniref:Uncharacterized protein n=1 Tax=Dunaliella salina TaxID=3046 RepID=A0ABQ7GXG6_DUNSA|nr:hypothetical protein DUNSADRAFT_1166 [Dunaliella salina]|eukprot:KAF5839293.1 hypothetical protein DUNSADRAFT_1166 [Dunaliella salina]